MAERVITQPVGSYEHVALELTKIILHHERKPEGVAYKDWALDVFTESLNATYGRRKYEK